MVRELEATLEERWGVGNVIFMTNGTVVLQIALKALGITGKVITTPFSYVATLTSIIWEGCEPVFVDVDKASFNINADLIEEAIDEGVEAILATHVFGNPCDVERIKIIADKYDLKVIYDAAHCFDALTSGSSLLSHGDVSTISFHATKLFHTVEGGALITDDQEIAYRARKMRNFGHNGPLLFDGVGINGKNSEFHAAMGLVNLAHMPEVLKRRREQFDLYIELLDKNHLSFQIHNLILLPG
jgi:dTDP-4-amino-4,6-dideoxygalactose transaminase